MSTYRVYNGNKGAVMSAEWDIIEQWGGTFTPEEVMEWAHEKALIANTAYDRTYKNYEKALAFAKKELGEDAEISKMFAWGGIRVDSIKDAAGIEHSFRTFDIAGIKNTKHGELGVYSVKVDNFGECEMVSWLA